MKRSIYGVACLLSIVTFIFLRASSDEQQARTDEKPKYSLMWKADSRHNPMGVLGLNQPQQEALYVAWQLSSKDPNKVQALYKIQSARGAMAEYRGMVFYCFPKFDWHNQRGWFNHMSLKDTLAFIQKSNAHNDYCRKKYGEQVVTPNSLALEYPTEAGMHLAVLTTVFVPDQPSCSDTPLITNNIITKYRVVSGKEIEELKNGKK